MENMEDTQRAKLIIDLVNAFRAFSDEAAKLRLRFLQARTPISPCAYDDLVKQSSSENHALEKYLKLKQDVLTRLKEQIVEAPPGPEFAMRDTDVVETLRKTG
jgi:hypothetical protein